MSKSTSRIKFVAGAALALLTTACSSDLTRDSRSPTQVYIQTLSAASGAAPGLFSGTLNSDVVTIVERTVNGTQVPVPTVLSDIGRVTMALVLKDPGQPGVFAQPTPLNNVTFTNYRVVYKRADGRNTAGVDVPFPWDGATTFTVPEAGSVTVNFELVRTVAKMEAPLAALVSNANVITTIAELTFFGHDQTGNAASTTGSIGIAFGNFGDPK